MANGAFGAVLLTLGAGAALLAACTSTNDARDAGADGASSSGSTVVTGSGLATSCSTDDNCVGVYFGDVCGFCGTDPPNASIAYSAEAAYQTTLNAAQSRCPPLRAAGKCPTNETITTCAMGTCTLTTCSRGVASAHACKSTNDASDAGTDG